jgi:hypothetical protein
MSNVLVSGQPVLAIIDGNNDGPEDGDCFFQAHLDAFSNAVTIYSFQDNTTPLLACMGNYFGTAFMGHDSSSDFAGVDITSASIRAGLPFRAEIVDEETNPPNPPVELNDPMDAVFLSNPNTGASRGSGVLCSEGGIVSKGTLENGLSFVRSVSLYPNAQSPTFLRIPSLPLERDPPTSRVLLDAYVPVNNDGTMTLALDSDPNNILVRVDLNNLPFCTARSNAPTLSEWVLIGLAAALLAVGTWSAGRRQGFSDTLALP